MNWTPRRLPPCDHDECGPSRCRLEDNSDKGLDLSRFDRGTVAGLAEMRLEILRLWLAGTTCHHKSNRRVLFVEGPYAALRHEGHNEYFGKQNHWCGAKNYLVDLREYDARRGTFRVIRTKPGHWTNTAWRSFLDTAEDLIAKEKT